MAAGCALGLVPQSLRFLGIAACERRFCASGTVRPLRVNHGLIPTTEAAICCTRETMRRERPLLPMNLHRLLSPGTDENRYACALTVDVETTNHASSVVFEFATTRQPPPRSYPIGQTLTLSLPD